VLGQADVLTRIEDLAFILCWADEQGSVAISVSMRWHRGPRVDLLGRVAEVALPRLGLNFKARRRPGSTVHRCNVVHSS